jgi:hypothetical protein
MSIRVGSTAVHVGHRGYRRGHDDAFVASTTAETLRTTFLGIIGTLYRLELQIVGLTIAELAHEL